MEQHHTATTLTREADGHQADGDHRGDHTGSDHAGCGRCIGRRTALMGMGAVGVAGLLAACGGGDDEPSTGGAPSATTEPSAEPPSSEATTPAEPAPEATTPAEEEPAGEAIATTADVPVGSGFINDSAGVVVTQPAAGTFVAFSATCTHQGCAVTTVADGLITCDCHGSQYNVADGSVARGPAEQPLPPVAIVVDGDQILAG
ncbi:QcrA and Rieske domain-containing protein [Jiangella alkaliphila]|uniref:Cytochrome bc1 complex Rieske iron-sulfur subunit n=1 Tax=Jiangella alkaliphila TaxID=419479 RepID=A0A1H2L2A0_9ACTN|nr:Rieske (2Fe-2S) protein [Jiangella alkaliphila]SDU75123.1 Rieske Fe-S protein [Jiangella alkaliphila]